MGELGPTSWARAVLTVEGVSRAEAGHFGQIIILIGVRYNTGTMSIHWRRGEMTGRGWYGGRAGHRHASDSSSGVFSFVLQNYLRD
jgi:hypothetical protein